MKTSTITNTTNGNPIPVIALFADVQPLFRRQLDKDGIVKLLPVKNGRDEQINNDTWIYTSDRNGNYSINVPRAEFCIKRQLMQCTILESIGNKKITERLADFIENVSNKLVFEKKGIAYRVFLKKVGRKFDLACVKVYVFTISLGNNIAVEKIADKYKAVVTVDGTKPLSWVRWSYELIVCLPTTFNFNF